MTIKSPILPRKTTMSQKRTNRAKRKLKTWPKVGPVRLNQLHGQRKSTYQSWIRSELIKISKLLICDRFESKYKTALVRSIQAIQDAASTKKKLINEFEETKRNTAGLKMALENARNKLSDAIEVNLQFTTFRKKVLGWGSRYDTTANTTQNTNGTENTSNTIRSQVRWVNVSANRFVKVKLRLLDNQHSEQ